MKIVNFNVNKVTPEEIDCFYNNSYNALERYYSPSGNTDYKEIFKNYSITEINEMWSNDSIELSAEAGLMLLAYVESLFRTDFILRIESNKWRDQLTSFYKRDYDKTKPVYQYGLDSIFKAWKLYTPNISKEMEDVLNSLPQYFAYRNWMAHGRYWVFKDTNYLRKYNYNQILMLLDNVIALFGGKFKVKNFGINS